MRRSLRSFGASAIVAAMALVAAACGGDDAGTATDATVDSGVKSGVQEQLGGTATTTAEAPQDAPTTMEEWEALWAEERAAIVERIQSEGLGVSADGATLTGPEGFTIDLSACPAGWSATEGLTPAEIKVGHTTALSGTLADYGNIAKAMQAVFGYYNDEGVFTDSTGANRKITLIVKDDGYDAARTIPLVDELIDSEKVFAMWTLGSPNTLKTYDKLNQRCIPQPLSMTGHPAWGDPVNHPWTTGMQLAYNTEGVLLGSFIESKIDELGGKVKVASLVLNNDGGKAWDSGLKAFIAQSPRAADIEYVSETIEPQAPTVKDPMTTLGAQNPNVFIGMVAGTFCTQIITEAAENGMKESVDYLFQPSVCKAASFVGKDKVGGDGSVSDGWWIVGGGVKDFNADANSDDPFIAWGRDLLAEAGHDYKTSGSFGSGFAFAWPFVQALRIAGELEGGLTRPNFILALRSLDMTNPNTLPGVNFNMNGNADPYLVEGSDIAQYDSEAQAWVPDGSIIELSGKSQPCVFDQAAAICG
ncbi:MAG: ABC transporter substrate-binding protein [Acidimicrobiia bacterium]|nr:ABC transporter substrate-binding protein [Acidimicrobiia bacterium]